MQDAAVTRSSQRWMTCDGGARISRAGQSRLIVPKPALGGVQQRWGLVLFPDQWLADILQFDVPWCHISNTIPPHIAGSVVEQPEAFCTTGEVEPNELTLSLRSGCGVGERPQGYDSKQ